MHKKEDRPIVEQILSFTSHTHKLRLLLHNMFYLYYYALYIVVNHLQLPLHQ